jgi:hypothetical protein
VQIEKNTAGYSAFREAITNPDLSVLEQVRMKHALPETVPINQLKTYLAANYEHYAPDSAEGLDRSSDTTGTIIADLRNRTITVLAHQYRIEQSTIDEILDEDFTINAPSAPNSPNQTRMVQKIRAGLLKEYENATQLHPLTVQNDGVVYKPTGENVYQEYGLLSQVRSGTTESSLVLEKKAQPCSMFARSLRRLIKHPRNPTKENPTLHWVCDTSGRQVDEHTVLAYKVAGWSTNYTVPPTWTIIDGMTGKEY